MKRLLTYLFIVLGLAVLFNTPSKADTADSERYFCIEKIKGKQEMYYLMPWYSPNISSSYCNFKIYKKDYERSFLKLNKFGMKGVYAASGLKRIHGNEIIRWTKDDDIFLSSYGELSLNPNPQPKPLKKEPSQTQEVAKKYCLFKPLDGGEKLRSHKNITMDVKADCPKPFAGGKWIEISFKEFKKFRDDKTQIAKKEPSQTQEVAGKIFQNTVFCMSDYAFISTESTCPKGTKITSKEYINYIINLVEGEDALGISYFTGKTGLKKVRPLDERIITLYRQFAAYEIDTEILDQELSNLKLNKYIAKKEPTIIPGDKPEDKDIDNDPPVIEIAEAITFNDSDYEFEGTVTDKSKQIFIEVDGRLVDVKKGKFTVKGYSPVDKEISIEAIDGYGNRSKPKIVKIIIDIKDTDIAEKLEPLNPSNIKVKSSSNKVALIIGIENYTEAPKATYANLDAKYFFDYARKAFGVKKQNINLLIDDKATLGKINQVLFKWLVGKVKANQTDLIIFFAGHGLASNDGKELYFLPQDGDPDLLSKMALSRTELFEQIIKLNPKSVTMFLDTCYSGVSRDEQMLLASARPIRIVADEQEGIPDNFTIFSATEIDQISSGLKEAKHGIFSYYLMKGLEGKADSNKDYKITNGELLAYMDQNVSQKAAVLGRQQNPMLSGDPDQVLMSYR